MGNDLKMAWLFPDTLSLHGDRGNVLAMGHIANRLGLGLEVSKIQLSDTLDPDAFDIIYMAAGELSRMKPVVESLTPVKEDLAEFIESGRPLLVTGSSIAFMGKNLVRTDKSVVDGLGLLTTTTWEKDDVHGDDILFEAEYDGKNIQVVGNQIRMADLELGQERPFGKLLYGYGNTGKDTNEGVLRKNSVFTNTLGPLLVLNPWLCVGILNAALKARGQAPVESNLDFKLEEAGLASKRQYIKNKKTDLKNCRKLR